MTKPKLALAAAVTLLALGGVGVAAWRILRWSGAGPALETPKLHVPERWKAVRTSDGHNVHIVGGVACGKCHDMARDGFIAVTAERCTDCHADHPLSIHTTSLARATTTCLDCHGFDEDTSRSPDNCARCHTGVGAHKRVDLHSQERCTQCHRPHETPALLPRTCTECHTEVAQAKHGKRAADAGTCTTCHGVHDPRDAADKQCSGCHQQRQPELAHALDRGHKSCTGCHQPHVFTKAAVKPCIGCHQNKPVLAADKHKACRSCHDEHAPKSTEAICAKCHKEKTTHPMVAAGKCLGCHPIHPPAGQTFAATAVPGFGPATLPATSCTSCHKEVATDRGHHAGNLACVSCHDTHGSHGGAVMPDKVKLCARCHAPQVKLARQAAGHTCNVCHLEPHQPQKKPPACATCHVQQNATAPAGHQNCMSCHEAHGGTQLATAKCATCHVTQAKQPHSAAGSCQTCHRAHGPGGKATPPTCTACHQPAKLPAMHAITAHQTCASCHKMHEATPHSNRASCTAGSCHKTLGAHEPTATSCIGCHPFSTP